MPKLKGVPSAPRALGPALKTFAAMLVEEAKEISGLPFQQLDEAMGYEHGSMSRYAGKKRAPQPAGIQRLENDVARLLKRIPHQIVVRYEDPHAIDTVEILLSGLGPTGPDLNFRQLNPQHLQLAYAGDWPTYHRLKDANVTAEYMWQWGVLWDANIPGYPWTREALGLAPDEPVESFLPDLSIAMFEREVRTRAALQVIYRAMEEVVDGQEQAEVLHALLNTASVAGILPEPSSDFELSPVFLGHRISC